MGSLLLPTPPQLDLTSFHIFAYTISTFFIIHKEPIVHISSIFEDLRQRSMAIGPWITVSTVSLVILCFKTMCIVGKGYEGLRIILKYLE